MPTLKQIGIRAAQKLHRPRPFAEATVSSVLKGKANVSQKTRWAIRAAARELGEHFPFIIGVVIPEAHHYFYASILQTLRDVTSRQQYDLLVVTPAHGIADETTAIMRTMAYGAEALIIIAATSDATDFISKTATRYCPIVTLNIPDITPHKWLATVNIDHRQGARQLASHLIQLGHTNIAYLAGREIAWSSQERYAALKKTLARNGIPLQDQWVIRTGDRWPDYRSGYLACQDLLKQGKSRNDLPTAIFAYNDAMAIGAMCALREAGKDNISVVGNDNSDVSNYIHPKLTTVGVNVKRLCTLILNILVRLIKSTDEDKPLVRRMKPQLVRPGSSVQAVTP